MSTYQTFYDGPDQPHKAVTGRTVLSSAVRRFRASRAIESFLIPRLSRFTLGAYNVYYKNVWLITYNCHAAGVELSWERRL